jgi:maltodextrin utilization protein YvdJ
MNARIILAIAIAVISVWAGAASTFAVIFGQENADIIVAVSTLIVASLGAALGVLSTQTNQVSSVADMRGVEHIAVNDKASPALAQMAIDPTVKGVQPTTEAVAVTLTQIAKAS